MAEWTCNECGVVLDSRRAGMHTMHHRKAQKAKERVQGNDAAVTATAAPAVPIPIAPPGFVVVFNRLPKPFELFYDHIAYAFKPHEYRVLSEEAALFLEASSIVRLDQAANQVIRALVTQQHPKFGHALASADWVEMIDRTTNDNPLGRGTRGLKTKPTLVAVSGAAVGGGKEQ